jgi:phosphoserine phosphatase
MSRLGVGFRTVIFDCDSTIAAIEGIDELAGSRAAEVAELTDAAMAGTIPLEEVYGRRLEIIRPSRDQVEALAGAYRKALVEDAADVVAALRWLGKDVRLLSGGLLPPVAAIGHDLGLSAEAVAAVPIRFHADGSYAGFGADSPLARSGGKAEQIAAWNLPHPVALVGDGATDAEARPAVDAFIAYMGVVFRAAVAARGDVVLRARSLAPVLVLAADDDERARLRDSPWAELFTRGTELLSSAADSRAHSSQNHLGSDPVR